jgi:hypothetical protein
MEEEEQIRKSIEEEEDGQYTSARMVDYQHQALQRGKGGASVRVYRGGIRRTVSFTKLTLI